MRKTSIDLILLSFIIGCSSETRPTDLRQADLGISDVATTTDIRKNSIEICEGLSEDDCSAEQRCTIVLGRRIDVESGCLLESEFAVCSSAPQCNNGALFYYADRAGTCWQINGCSPKEWYDDGRIVECYPTDDDPDCE